MDNKWQEINNIKIPINDRGLKFGDGLFETILISANEELVSSFLKNKIKFNDISHYLLQIIKIKELRKYIYKRPKNINEILKNIKICKNLTNKFLKVND